MECYAGPSAGSVAKRFSALAGGDLFRKESRDTDCEERAGIYLDRALGTVAIPGVDGRAGARGADEVASRQWKVASSQQGTDTLGIGEVGQFEKNLPSGAKALIHSAHIMAPFDFAQGRL
jgi:hypothetical protein